MRQFTKNSIAIIIFFAAISTCIFIAFSFSYTAISGAKEYLTFLTDDAYLVKISQYNEDTYQNKHLYKFIEKQGTDDITVIKLNSFSSSIEACLNDKLSGLPSVKIGRTFKDDEISKGAAVMLISEEKLSDCIMLNEKYYHMVEGRRYEVIGVLNSNNIDGIVPLMRVLKDNSYSTINGTFYIDAGKSTEEVVQTLMSAIHSINNEAEISYTKIDSSLFNSSVFPDVKIIVLVVIAVMFLMMLNLYSINTYWFNGKECEIYTYRLCGINNTNIWLKMTWNYFVLVLTGAITGFMFATIFIIATNYMKEPPFVYYFKTMLIVCVVSIIGIVYCSLKLKEFIKERG